MHRWRNGNLKNRVVITGMGAVTPIGNSVSKMWSSVKEGQCGIGPITRISTQNRKVKLAAEVKDFHPEEVLDPRDIRKMDLYTQYAMVAAAEAMTDSGINLEATDLEQFGVIVASGIGGLGTIEKDFQVGLEKGFDRISPYFIPMAISNIAAGRIAIQYGLKGSCSCVVTACASGANAIGDGFRMIKDGYAKTMLCGGAEASITELGLGGFTSLKALSQNPDQSRASIPFDKERSGFVLGEGAGILILEELEQAQKRGAKIYGEILGYGSNCDAFHITAPMEEGTQAARCMELAMKEANLKPEAIAYINAHGTSTPMNDRCETKAVKLAFGQWSKQLAMSSTKSMTGHLLGASGAVESIITTLALKEGYQPATIHYQQPDSDCDLDIIPNQGRQVAMKYALSNSLGFGGHNASLLFGKYEDENK